LAMENEFDLALGYRLARVGARSFELPSAAVPHLDGPAAVLALRDRALEIAVVERMVLDLDGQPLVARIERGPARHRPRAQDAVELDAEIVVQSRRRMFLHDEARVLGRRDRGLAAGLRRLGEIALRP